MPLSVFGMKELLERLKDLKKIKSAKLDGKPVEILESKVELGVRACDISCRFKHEGKEHTVEAHHPWKEDADSNVIKIDGRDVEQDDVDLDADWHFGSVKLEYRLEYKQDGTPHEIVLNARAGLF